MILFELKCAQGHHFEGWFKDNASYDAQLAGGHLTCPVCGHSDVAKAIMAPRLNKATGSNLEAEGAALEIRKALAAIRQEIESKCENVGEKFADEARKIHYGDAEARPIYGDATNAEAAELEEEGINIARVPWIKDN